MGITKKCSMTANQNVIRRQLRDHAIEQNAYDDEHNLIEQIDGNGNRTTFVYDDRRNLMERTRIFQNLDNDGMPSGPHARREVGVSLRRQIQPLGL